MIKSAIILLCIALLCTATACGQPSSGAGFGSSIVGDKALVHAYGHEGDEKLVYVIFSDLDAEETTSSVSSGTSVRSGYFEDKKGGSTIRYEATATGIDIAGTRYDFGAGRVFLLSTQGGATAVTQLGVPFSAATYEAEIEALESHPDVKAFRAKAGTR